MIERTGLLNFGNPEYKSGPDVRVSIASSRSIHGPCVPASPACVPYVPKAQGSLPRGPVRVPASGVP